MQTINTGSPPPPSGNLPPPDTPPVASGSGSNGLANGHGLSSNPNPLALNGQNLPPRNSAPLPANGKGKGTVIQQIAFEDYTELVAPEITFTTTSQLEREAAKKAKPDGSSTPPEPTQNNTQKPTQKPTQELRNVPEFTYTTSSQVPHPVPPPVITQPPPVHLSNNTSFVPGMGIGNPTGDLANAAYQASADGANMAESGMNVGMGQLGQVMTLGMKQQTEMATMKIFTDMANAIAKEVRNVSKGVKDQAGN